MSGMRLVLLLVGPFALTGGAYWLAAPQIAAGASSVTDAECPIRRATAEGLRARCEAVAAELCGELGGTPVVVHAPFVLAGDFDESELNAFHERLIEPVTGVLALSYFDTPPAEPISIVLCESNSSLRRHSGLLGGPRRSCYAGFYLREHRRIVVDVSTGHGTLIHELVHALAHADFPALPEWFDEGLASLHEQCEFTDGDTRLVGVRNWRREFVRQALAADRLRTLAELMADGRIRPEREAVDYAHARAVCLFLQARGRLAAFYRKLRTTGDSPRNALLAVFPGRELDEIEHDFRDWLETDDVAHSRS